MLVMRFSRVGRKNKPQFRIVLQEHTWAPTGKHVEILGSWDPLQKKGSFKNERIQYWLDKGVQASDSVHNLLVSQEVIKADKIKIKISKKKSEENEGSAETKEPAEDKDGTTKEDSEKELKKEEAKEEDVKEESALPEKKEEEAPKEEKEAPTPEAKAKEETKEEK
jgi:small subunit ribosomal protein S16